MKMMIMTSMIQMKMMIMTSMKNISMRSLLKTLRNGINEQNKYAQLNTDHNYGTLLLK